MIVYFPSCKFTADFPEASRKIRGYLADQSDVTVAGCCRPGQTLLSEGDTALTICTTCAIITQEVSPQAHEMSVFEYLLNDAAFPWPNFHGERMVIQDCWRVRNDAGLQDAVRECMRRMNIVPVELPENRAAAEFDGVWRFNPAQAGNLAIAPKAFSDIRDHHLTLLPKEEQRKRMEAYVRALPKLRTVAYCNACVGGLRMGGADVVHLMELAVQEL